MEQQNLPLPSGSTLYLAVIRKDRSTCSIRCFRSHGAALEYAVRNGWVMERGRYVPSNRADHA